MTTESSAVASACKNFKIITDERFQPFMMLLFSVLMFYEIICLKQRKQIVFKVKLIWLFTVSCYKIALVDKDML